MIQSVNPATEELIRTYDEMDEAAVNEILRLNYQEFLRWKKVAVKERAGLMRKAANMLRTRREVIAKMMTIEMGKLYLQSKAEVDKCAWVCDHYAEYTEKYTEDEVVETDASRSFITYQPLGPVLAVMPWNFPLWQVIRFAAPALMAGNSGILKHASNVTGSALLIEEIFRESGFPENLFRTIIVSSGRVASVISNKNIQAVTLTGSVGAGKSVASAAGRALKKTVLELGGSDPYIILEDADLDKAAETCVTSRLINNGQSCIAAKRFIVVEDIYDEFEELFLAKISNKKMGDPFFENTELGPLSSLDSRNELHEQVIQSEKKGARVLTGGNIPNMKGAFYPATVITDIKPGMPAYDDELFGPVASLIRVKDEEEAVRVANDTVFGLGAAVFTSDISRGEELARNEIHAGCCFVNDYVRSDPRLPFGGVKESGYGRELSYFGIREFMNIKSVYIK
jgi:succinate-semialdehyde dehydrogenase / glutarate-semialdehyde dehydrogenase